jgi:GNAT superfamily N-acetyltransferase
MASVSPLVPVPVAGDDPQLLALLADVVVELAARYGDDDPGSIHGASPEARWVLVRDHDGRAIACGGLQPLSWTVADADPGLGEIKRVYVVPDARGRGLSRAVMTALLETAREAGYRTLWLETGTEQPEALALYRRSGWTEIPVYGQYTDDPRTVCFALDL